MMQNFRGRLMDLSQPRVMGILNATPDSFYAASRMQTADAIALRADAIVAEGGAIIDVGAYSSRPGAAAVSPDDEMRRLATALDIVRRRHPEVPLSVDTFRAEVARRCVRDFGVDIINDIGGGELDGDMFETVAELGVAYVLTHSRGIAQLPEELPDEEVDEDSFLAEVARYLALRLQRLQALGVADVILDPGFGFGKTLRQNFQLMRRLPDLMAAFPDAPMLVGISRKSMIYRLLGITPERALNGTTVLNTVALQAGAHILRVHDVREAVEAVRIHQALIS